MSCRHSSETAIFIHNFSNDLLSIYVTQCFLRNTNVTKTDKTLPLQQLDSNEIDFDIQITTE